MAGGFSGLSFSGLIRVCQWLALAVWASALSAQDILGPQTALEPYFTYAQAPGAQPEQMLALFRAGGFSPRAEVNIYAANHAPELWAASVLSAPSDITGRLLLRAPLISAVDIYVAEQDPKQDPGQGALRSVLSYSLFRPYKAEQHAQNRLQSEPITLLADAPVTLLVHYKLGPFARTEMHFETAETTLRKQVTQAALTGAYYAFSLATVLVFLTLFAALRDWISLAYAGLFFVGMGLLAFMDGLLFRWLYPNTPQVQSAVGFFLLFGLAGAGLLLAALGFRARGQAGLMRAAVLAIGACALGYAAALVAPGPYVAAFSYLMLGVMSLAVIAATRLEAPLRRHFRLAHLIAYGAVSGLLALLLGLLVPGLLPRLEPLSAAKLVYLLVVLTALANFAAKTVLTRREKDAALAAEVTALTREAEISRALLASEQNYARARDLAQARSRQLATASHDLRQPLVSLRMTVDGLAAGLDAQTRARLNDAFDYISSLSGSYLDAAAARPVQEPESQSEPPAQEDAYCVTLILQTVHQMFCDEASAKGLRFRYVASSVETQVPAMALMRIVSNLASNAIKYTPEGGVVMGICHEHGVPVLRVVDTGPGLGPDALERLRHEGVRGADSTGHGLGLSVCFGLAQEHGLRLTARAVPGRGTGFGLTLAPRR